MNTVLAPVPEQLVVRTVKIPDIPHLLTLVSPEGGLAWVQGTPNNQQGLVAWGEVARMELSGPERFSRAQRWWSNWSTRCVGDNPVAFASFAFSSDPGNSVIIVPEVVIKRQNNTTTMTITAPAEQLDAIAIRIQAQVESVSSREFEHTDVAWSTGSQELHVWEQAVDTAIERISHGELDKVVLARDLLGTLDKPLHVGALLDKLNATFPDCWTFSVDGLVGATPELLIRRTGEHVTSRVLAGTVRRSSDMGRDGALAQALLGSDKDQEEHAYAVESVAGALTSHCTDLNVPSRPFILRLANVQHLATDVTGELVDDASALALAASLHPTAAVCGTPMERAKQVIRELEGLNRGRYAGPIGWIDRDGDGEFGIALRCAQIENPHRTSIRLFAGCGIVAGSTSQSEIAESDAKFSAMRNALTPGS